MSGLLEGRVALITGGARGIGLAIGRAFVDAGARIVLADVEGRRAGEAAGSLEVGPDRAAGIEGDVRDPASARQMVDRTVELGEGRLDVLVNNAGIVRDATLRKMTLEHWQDVLDVHLNGTFLMTQAAAAVMRERKTGAIVNISSISGKVGMVGQANYSAAKAGMVGLTKAAAKELAHHGVRVNAIQPGIVETPMTAALREDIWQKKLSEVPMGRAAKPHEIGSVALFLASDLASYMTGTVSEVTGGRFM